MKNNLENKSNSTLIAGAQGKTTQEKLDYFREKYSEMIRGYDTPSSMVGPTCQEAALYVAFDRSDLAERLFDTLEEADRDLIELENSDDFHKIISLKKDITLSHESDIRLTNKLNSIVDRYKSKGEIKHRSESEGLFDYRAPYMRSANYEILSNHGDLIDRTYETLYLLGKKDELPKNREHHKERSDFMATLFPVRFTIQLRNSWERNIERNLQSYRQIYSNIKAGIL